MKQNLFYKSSTCLLDITKSSPDFSKRKCEHKEGYDRSEAGDDDDGVDTNPHSATDQSISGDGQNSL